MANLPLILSLADDLGRLSMASSYYNEPLFHSYHNPYNTILPRELNLRSRGLNEPGPLSHIGKDGFQVSLDVNQFKPSELNVKVVDNFIVVEGKHEEREDDHGHIFRHFVRRYHVPKNYDANKVVSTLSSDGVLTIKVQKPQVENKANERIVQIQQVGPAHLNVKPVDGDDKNDKTPQQQPT